jgi:alanine racemase
VHLVRSLAAGERPSYGRVYELERDSRVVVVPLGYADGLPFGLTRVGAEVLIRGKRRRIAGRVTMDQVIVDIEDDASIVEGDEVVFIGRQGDEEITATEWAGMLDTIPYEVLVGIGARVPRVVVNAKPTSTGG